MSKETLQFQTEVKQILDIMIHSLYSQREVFLRELLSNASDALSKLRFEEVTQPQLSSGEKHIRLKANKEEHSLSIFDNGIGMTHDELIQNIGTIAYSGSKQFLQRAKELKDHPELIGQFGVGFYSAFMVAERVQLHTQKAGTQEGVVWESTGDGSYTVESRPRAEGTGTTITLFLKKKEENDDSYQDFTDEWTLRSTVKKYSDFIEYPIKMQVTRDIPEKDADGKVIEGSSKTQVEDETLNSRKALWLRPAKEVTKEEYNEFYKQLAMDWTDPLDVIHYKAEGTQEFSAMVYIPSTVPHDYYQRNVQWGLNLYVKRVFITAHCEEILPPYLRFLKGVIDSSDLPLNVSRELIQKDKRIVSIRKAIISKMLRHFKTMLENDRPQYVKFWEKFGATLKEGVASDYENKEALQDLLLFHSSSVEERVSLKEYVNRMKEGQKAIYYITGESITQLSGSPYLEKLRKHGYEVLFLIDPVDEWVMNSLHEYDKKPFQSITTENLDLGENVDPKKKEEELKTQQERFSSLTDLIKETLKESIKDVKFSTRLVDSPAVLVSGAHDPSAHMERIMEAMGQSMPKAKRILEINPEHAVFEKMLTLSDDRKKLWAELLYNQALLNEGSTIQNPSRFSKLISELMV
jgi:molecular chaperone HtpG